MIRRLALIAVTFAMVALPLAGQNRPAVVYSTLLNGMKFEYEMGRMKIERLRCVHFPDADGSGGFEYNPADGGKFETKITHLQTGLVYAEMKWYGKKEVEPYWSFERYDVNAETQPTAKDGWMEFKTAGEYKMEFFLDGDVFWVFPFSISKLEGLPDVDPIEKYFLEGPWNDYAQLFFLGGRSEANLKFIVWLQNKDRRPRKDATIQLVLTKDGSLVGSSSFDAEKVTLFPAWQRFELPVAKIVRDTSGAESRLAIRAEEILRQPGNYTFVLTMNGEMYGIYPFIVKDGHVQWIREQDPEEAKKSQLLYGGDGVYLLKRGK